MAAMWKNAAALIFAYGGRAFLPEMYESRWYKLQVLIVICFSAYHVFLCSAIYGPSCHRVSGLLYCKGEGEDLHAGRIVSRFARHRLFALVPGISRYIDKQRQVCLTSLLPMALLYCVRHFEYACGYQRTGSSITYFPDALAEIYAGKSASLYLSTPCVDFAQTEIPDEYISCAPRAGAGGAGRTRCIGSIAQAGEGGHAADCAVGGADRRAESLDRKGRAADNFGKGPFKRRFDIS